MAKVSTNISLDADLKRQSQALLEEFGMDLSGAVTMFLKQMLRERAIPFAIREVPNQKTIAAINEYYYMKMHPDKYKRYENFDEMMEDIFDDA